MAHRNRRPRVELFIQTGTCYFQMHMMFCLIRTKPAHIQELHLVRMMRLLVVPYIQMKLI